MKLGLVAAGLVLVAGGAVGCGDDGGGGSADDSTSKEDFCAAFQAFEDDLKDMTGQEANLGEILKKGAQRIEDVGAPEDIPDDAKDGLQLTLDALLDLPDDATVEDMTRPRGRLLRCRQGEDRRVHQVPRGDLPRPR